MRKYAIAIILLYAQLTQGQDLSIMNGWKFKTGDQQSWSSTGFDDSSWPSIDIGKAWENQGYANYNGFAWYRLHIVIPSSIREKAFLKEKLRFDLGKIDDGDEFYLNGFLVGRNGGRNADIKNGAYDQQRSYTLSLNDSRIFWDKENVIAVRVWDGGGDGGMYEGSYGISVMDVTDFVNIHATENDFQLGPGRMVAKNIELRSTSEQFDFTGKLFISITDAVTGATVYKQTIGTDFAKNRPFAYTYHASLPENKSYRATYIFEEARSKKQVRVTEGIPYLLTPKSPAIPRINGPAIYGVRPKNPFLYRIPATGEKPLAYEVSGLPKGLTLDKQSGILTGAIAQAGTYSVTFTVKNKAGFATKKMLIRCGEAIGLTPALGWNSWNCWGLSVSDEKVRASARAMTEKLADHGWAYINIDDGWEDRRNEKGEMLTNSKFPDLRGLAAYVHGLGLKIGIYSSPGTLTCGGFAGSYQHEQQDADSYSAWGIDYLKYDWCSYGQIAPATPTLDEYKKPYQVMRDALAKNSRDIIFSLCQYGMGDVWKWGAEVGGNSWRTTGDITDSWSSMSSIGFAQDQSAPYCAPGHFNDPDMLVVGRVGWGPGLHRSRLTPDEQYTHISLWSLLSAPLLIGCDMSQLDEFTLNLLTNDEVLAIDQDERAGQAKKFALQGQLQVWVKPLADGSSAVGVFNTGDQPLQSRISFASLGLGLQLKLRDCWRQQDLGTFRTDYGVSVPAHGVLLLRVKTAQ